jgi:hypothetical protein
MATVLNYQVFNDVVSASDMLTKFIAFAVANGWTMTSSVSDLGWTSTGGGNYGFALSSPGERNIELQALDYGGMTETIRFRLMNTASIVSDNQNIVVGILEYTDGNMFCTKSSIQPVIMAATGGGITTKPAYHSQTMAVKATNIPAVWFFGNSKVLYIAIKYSANYSNIYGFGCLEMFDQTQKHGWFNFINRIDGTTWAAQYADINGYNSMMLQATRPGTSLETMQEGGWILKDFYANKTQIVGTSFTFYGSNLNQNLFSEIRPAIHHFYHENIDGTGVWRPFAKSWYVKINTKGLLIGEQIKYGAEKYITFPHLIQNVDLFGFAFRIE